MQTTNPTAEHRIGSTASVARALASSVRWVFSLPTSRTRLDPAGAPRQRTTGARATGAISLLIAAAVIVGACGRATDEPVGAVTADNTDTNTAEATVTAPAPDPTTATTPETAPPTQPPTIPTTPPTTAPATASPGSSNDTGTAATSATADGPILPTDLVLTSAGVGPFVFGALDGDVVYGLEPLLGYATTDETTVYTDSFEGQYFDDSQASFTFPVGREACYQNGLCVHFGGDDETALTFVGFWQGEPVTVDESPLATQAGVTVGSVWADFPDAMTVNSGGCYTNGWGQADGVDLDLTSSTVFAVPNDSGDWTTSIPAQSDVTVRSLHAGSVRTPFADC